MPANRLQQSDPDRTNRRTGQGGIAGARAYGLACLTGLALLSSASLASAEPRFSGIAVDTRAISGTQRYLKPALLASLEHYFSDDLTTASDAPTLIVRVTDQSIDYSPAAGARGKDGGTSTDFLEGTAFVVGRDGAVLERYPMRAVVNSNEGGWYLPGHAARKARRVSDQFAFWLEQKMPGD